uniref:DUF4148 domain-containing protein n=1 Tax=Parastrongyloides trichosuri TaxID=131310 RepID=A0A0N4ZEP3_PARTI
MYIVHYEDENGENYEWNGQSYSSKEDAIAAINNKYPGGRVTETGESTPQSGNTYIYVKSCDDAPGSKPQMTTRTAPRKGKYSNNMFNNKNVGDTISGGVVIPNKMN